MKILDKIKKFLSDTNDISFGYNEINFIAPDSLDEEQIGYCVDTNGNSLVTGNEGDWMEDWLVIGSDQLGDPIIVDISSSNLIVMSAAHGEGIWEPFAIADSLQNFIKIILILKDISKDRSNPVDIEKNPITDKERKNILTKIEKDNPDTEIWYWENFFEND